MTDRARLLLADDHRLVAEALREFLGRDYDVVGAVGTGAALLEAARELRPQVVVTDVSMSDLDGIAVTRRLKAELPGMRVVLLSMYDDPETTRRGLAAGADGFVAKQAPPEELRRAIEAALRGGEVVVATRASAAPPPASPAHELSERQREVVALVAMGLPMKRIALKLGISPKTVEFHKYNAMKRLALRSTPELVRWAAEQGILPEGA